MIGTIWFLLYRHGQAYWFAMIILVIGEHIFSGICLLKYTSFYVVNINLTLSHSQVA